MIKFDNAQEQAALQDLVTFTLETQFDNFIEFICENGCAGLTEDELDEFEDMDEMLFEDGIDDPFLHEKFQELAVKAALDPDTRHVYALATRLDEAMAAQEAKEEDGKASQEP